MTTTTYIPFVLISLYHHILLDICHGQRMDCEMVLYLVFEHVDQDLNLYIEKCPPTGLAPDRIKDIMWQILSGVDFIHSHRIVHRYAIKRSMVEF